MQRNISTIWWRFGGFVMSLIGAVAWTHDAAAGCRYAESSYVRYKYGPDDEGVYPSGYSYQQYDASGVSTSDCDYTYDSSNQHYVDNEGCFADTTNTIGGEPWFCSQRWWYNASDAEVIAEVNSMLGSGWNSLSGTENWQLSTTKDNLLYTEGKRYGDRQLTVHPVTNGEGDVSYVLADYGYALQTIYRIIGCASGYTLNGASEDSVVTSLNGIYCTSSSGGGTTPVVPADCPGIPNDNNLITVYNRGDQGCFFWEADTTTHNLYDATGYFKYTTDCACWDDGSRICS